MLNLPVIRHLRVRPCLVGSCVLGAFGYLVLPAGIPNVTRMLLAWDGGVTLYLACTAFLMARTNEEGIRRHAEALDEGRFVFLVFTIAAALASLVAIVAEMSAAHGMTHGKWLPVGLSAATVLLSWLFLHTMFALHYTHDYYRNKEKVGGLDFPGDDAPDYWDFLYFALIIGTSGQTADVGITGKTMRRLAMVHCVLAFCFNTTIIALTVNIGAGLF